MTFKYDVDWEGTQQRVDDVGQAAEDRAGDQGFQTVRMLHNFYSFICILPIDTPECILCTLVGMLSPYMAYQATLVRSSKATLITNIVPYFVMYFPYMPV